MGANEHCPMGVHNMPQIYFWKHAHTHINQRKLLDRLRTTTTKKMDSYFMDGFKSPDCNMTYCVSRALNGIVNEKK